MSKQLRNQLTIDDITPEQKASYLAFAKTEWEKENSSGQEDFWSTTLDGLYDINVYEYHAKYNEDFDRFDYRYSVTLYDINYPPSDRLPIYLGDI